MTKKIEFVNADVREWAKTYDGPKFHAIFCDPPYEIAMMGRSWDQSGVAFDPEIWKAIGNHLLPGGFGMAFSSSRTWHRLAVAIEDAGFVIHPTIWLWAYGSGFPKATNIGTQIDKAAGAEREIVGKYVPPDQDEWNLRQSEDENVDAAPGSFTASGRRTLNITAPATELARVWDGHRYGLQALKPAAEPIILFAKAKDKWYNSLRDELIKTDNLLEELWKELANRNEIASAAHGVNTILLKALKQQDQTYSVSGSTVDTARNSNTSHLKYCGSTPASEGATVPASATESIGPNLPSELVSSVEKSSLPLTPSRTVSIAVESAPMPPANSPCYLTPYEMGIDTNTLAGILLSNSEKAKLDLSTIWLWKLILVDLYEVASRSTIETGTSLTTELVILNYLLRKLTLYKRDMQSEKSLSGELLYVVRDVTRSFIGLLTYQREQELTAQSVVNPTIVFQKPYEGRPLDNITETGAGALNIEATRVGGRWPSNLIVGHTPECRKVGVESGKGYTINRWSDGAKPFGGGAGHEFEGEDVAETVEVWECVDGCPAKTINTQSGNGQSPSQTTNYGPHKTQPGANGTMGSGWNGDKIVQGYGDRGGASRFFFNFQAENLENGDPVFYCSKAARKERDAGLERLGGREIKTMNNRVCLNCGKSELDGRLDGACCDNPTYESGQVRGVKNPHIAVKPLKLTEYLAKMLLPPDAYKPRRILVPFAGSGSETIGAALAEWDEVVGVELDAEFIEIAEARVKFWMPEYKAKQLRLE